MAFHIHALHNPLHSLNVLGLNTAWPIWGLPKFIKAHATTTTPWRWPQEFRRQSSTPPPSVADARDTILPVSRAASSSQVPSSQPTEVTSDGQIPFALETMRNTWTPSSRQSPSELNHIFLMGCVFMCIYLLVFPHSRLVFCIRINIILKMWLAKDNKS